MRFSGPRRTALVALVACLAVVTATGVFVWAVSRSGPESRGPAPAPVAAIAPRAAPDLTVVRAVSSLAVLRTWDRARATAWSRGSVGRLRRLYAPGSRAGAEDVARLAAWRQRGLRVQGMGMQVLAVTLLRRTATTLVLVVTDRLVGAVAVPADAARAPRRTAPGRALPRDGASTRRLRLVRRDGRWLMASVTALAAQPADAAGSRASSPAASTASTSGSANS